MDIKTAWHSIMLSFALGTLVLKAAHVICIAIAFEFIAWWLGRRIEAFVTPYITIDGEREPTWRMRRRATLRQTPKLISRTLCYTLALILIFDVFGVPVLSLAVGLGAVALLFGAALMPLLRDVTQGYMLLAEDVIAVGDTIEVRDHRGVVEKFSLRAIALRDEAGQLHSLSNRNVRDVIVVNRHVVGHDGNAQR